MVCGACARPHEIVGRTGQPGAHSRQRDRLRFHRAEGIKQDVFNAPDMIVAFGFRVEPVRAARQLLERGARGGPRRAHLLLEHHQRETLAVQAPVQDAVKSGELVLPVT